MYTRYLCFPGGKRKALTFSYDDGVEQDIRLTEIFRKHNLKATFNLNSGYFSNEDGSDPFNLTYRHLSRSEALKVYTPDLFEVACHGVHHELLPYCDTAAACVDVIDDRRNLETLFGRQIHGMAYANGSFNDDVVNILKYAGIYYCRSVISTLKFDLPTDWLRMPATCHHKNPKLMELGDQFLEMKPKYQSKIFYVWGHSYEFDVHNNWHIIEDFAKKMSNQGDIWYCTNLELYQAWLDYSRLESSADGMNIFNPNIRTVWIRDKQGTVYEILPGHSVQLK